MVPNLFSVVDAFDDLAESCGPQTKPVKTLVRDMWLDRLKAVFDLILSLLRINVCS